VNFCREARSEAGKIIASGEFSQVVQSDEVTMRLTYKFVDGSIDDDMFWVCKMFYLPKGEMWIACVYDDAHSLLADDQSTTVGELAPVEAEVHDQQRGKCERNHADGG
jgi:hypothetical protein